VCGGIIANFFKISIDLSQAFLRFWSKILLFKLIIDFRQARSRL
jgi:hypothetical protein